MTATESSRRLPHDWFPGSLPHNVRIGEGAFLYSTHAFLRCRSEQPCGVHIGAHSGVYPGTHFNLGRHGAVTIGEYCTLVGVIFSADVSIAIGDYGLFAHGVTVADRPDATPDDAFRTDGTPSGEIIVGENVWVGAHATILLGARIHHGAVIGAGAVVDFDVPPYAIVAGNPARIVGDARTRR